MLEPAPDTDLALAFQYLLQQPEGRIHTRFQRHVAVGQQDQANLFIGKEGDITTKAIGRAGLAEEYALLGDISAAQTAGRLTFEGQGRCVAG